MRKSEDKVKIEATLGSTFTISNFISDQERLALIDYFTKGDHTYKNTGPITLNVLSEEFKQPLFQNILSRVESYIGKVKVFSSLFFYVERPHIIHNDDSFSYPLCYKGINIPLDLEYIEEGTGYPSLIFYDQYYLEGPAKFFNGSRDIPTYYNKCVYEYGDVKNISTSPICDDIRSNHLSHLKPNWLQGLSIETITEWRPGNVTVFDTVRLHSSNDFCRQGIKSKLGLSIFTEKL